MDAQANLIPRSVARSELRCAVVICTKDRPRELELCLAGVLAQEYPNFEVLVVDNASKNNKSQEVAARNGVQYIAEPRRGLSVARNRGARESVRADVIAYIDDDAIPEEGWITALCEEFLDPRVMGVVGRIVATNPETEGARACIAMKIVDGGTERIIFDRENVDWFDLLRAGPNGGANLAVRRRAFSDWRGFDERLGLGAILEGGEEDYALFSLVKAGHTVIYCPRAVVRHNYPSTLSDLRAKHLRTLKMGAGYLTFLFVEEPHFRTAIWRHVLNRLPRHRRRSFKNSATEARRLAPPWREWIAGLAGFVVFLRSFFMTHRVRESDYNG